MLEVYFPVNNFFKENLLENANVMNSIDLFYLKWWNRKMAGDITNRNKIQWTII